MAIRDLRIQGYRSLKDIWVRLQRVNVVYGPNGVGKTSFYRALLLLNAAAQGTLARALADEGGMPSVLYAGTRGKGPLRLSIAVKLEALKYRLELGVVTPGASPFITDPDVKEETVHYIDGKRDVSLLERKGLGIHARDEAGKRVTYPSGAAASESVLSELQEPHRFPDLFALRQEIGSWRFYHQFRTDGESPLRQPQTAVFTPKLGHDGRDVASVLRSIEWVGDRDYLYQAIDQAFPGATLALMEENGRLSPGLLMPGMRRAFEARELSDGTLQYLALLSALLSPRPPSLIALNEPEASIHPSLLRPLASLITRASRQSQVVIVTHSSELADDLLDQAGAQHIELTKADGETKIVGQRLSADD